MKWQCLIMVFQVQEKLCGFSVYLRIEDGICSVVCEGEVSDYS